MKRWVVFFVILALILFLRPSNVARLSSNKHKQVAPTHTIYKNNSPQTISAFVPYWHIESIDQIQNPINSLQFTQPYYFGITLTKTGEINTTESGYANLNSFNSSGAILAVRLIDQSIVDAILEDDDVATRASASVARLAKHLGFDGILIDLEYSALASPTTKSQITNTISSFVNQGHKNDLSVGVTIYGDSFYRGRPYDIKKIGLVADEVVVMAYDFHKSKSLPGPLFPFEKGSYGYSFKDLVTDFVRVVPADKLRIAYGMYGYQWETDRQERPIKRGSAIPYRNIVSLKDKCALPDCAATIDPTSKELTITTKLPKGLIVIHSETPASIQKKIDFTNGANITKSVLWTNGYW